MIERPDYVRVKNTMADTIVGRFAGKDYYFKKGEPLDIHLDAARHIFGFKQEDKSSALARLGWATSSDQIPAAMDRLMKVSFSPSPPLIDQELREPPMAESAAEQVPERTGDAFPLVNGGKTGTSVSGAPVEPNKVKK